MNLHQHILATTLAFASLANAAVSIAADVTATRHARRVAIPSAYDREKMAGERWRQKEGGHD